MLSLTRHLDTFPHAAMVQTFTKRPTSPLFYEPLYTPPEDILYPGSDEEVTPDEREKKRLRVEILGQQYLNGRPLFIQSAGLRGPFEKGWVNPWRSKKKKYGIDDIRRFPAAEPERSHVEAGPSTAKRRFVKTSGNGSLNYDSENGSSLGIEASRQASAKRTRHGELDEPHGYHGSQRKIEQGVDAPGRTSYHWLKTDRSYPQALVRDDIRSSTPTPAAKPRSKSHATSSRPREDSGRAVTLPPKSSHQNRLSQGNDDTLSNGRINKITTLAASKRAHGETVKPNIPPGTIEPANDVPSNVREVSLSTIDNVTRYGYDEVKGLSQRAVRQAENEDGQRQAKKLSEAAVARAIESGEKKKHSRLTPYLSEVVVGSDAASSAALRAAKVPKPKPKPSSHAVPPSTYQPEFKYRYARKEMSTATSPQSAPFVDAPEQPQARLRSRSDSSSSSGSSAFAEALEAAQEKAALKSFASSKSTSPAIEGPETKSIKKNRQALRRLTFTPSGRAKLASALTSSGPSSSSSAIEPEKNEMQHQNKPLSNDPPFLQRTSTKSSARSLTNGNRSRNSIIFPEAQTDPIARPLAQVPSGPSTNLLETDNQSPKVPSFDEGDSYLDLSTQAAVLKAQRSFQADVVSALTPRRLKKEDSSPIGLTSRKAEITPRARGHREIELANAQLMKPSGSDDGEPMSTQAMVDAISPFAVTTIKKRPPAIQQRIDVVPSTTKKRKPKSPPQAPTISSESPSTVAFRTHSPGMSTSPSPSPSPEKSPPPIPLSHPTTNSKPRSSLTSFSILPNGTLTETSLYRQDGQQQDDFPDYDISLPADPFGFANVGGNEQRRDNDDALDLNAAIDEAGSFLGDWDVEAEARKEGSLSRKRESGGRGILKGSA